MAALIFLVLNLGASFFKSRCRLEAENAALRQEATRSGRVHERDRLSFIQLYRWFPSILKAPCWFSPLLALEISKAGRPAADRGRVGIDPADER
jgi:hypothetical protein